MRIALLGGSFNPPHIGHILNACYVLGAHRVDAVWFMPVYRHAFDKRLAPFDARVAMCERAIAPFGDRLAVTRAEAEAPQGCFTVDLSNGYCPGIPAIHSASSSAAIFCASDINGNHSTALSKWSILLLSREPVIPWKMVFRRLSRPRQQT